MNSTPEWAAIERVVNDEVARTDRIIAKQRKRIIRRAVLVVAIMLVGVGVGTVAASQSEAVSQVTINKFIRANGGIPPCTHEDGSGQPGRCFWNAKTNGDGQGHSVILVQDGPDADDDKDVIFITGPKASRW